MDPYHDRAPRAINAGSPNVEEKAILALRLIHRKVFQHFRSRHRILGRDRTELFCRADAIPWFDRLRRQPSKLPDRGSRIGNSFKHILWTFGNSLNLSRPGVDDYFLAHDQKLLLIPNSPAAQIPLKCTTCLQMSDIGIPRLCLAWHRRELCKYTGFWKNYAEAGLI